MHGQSDSHALSLRRHCRHARRSLFVVRLRMGATVENNQYSSLFYLMLVLGIIGVIGFLFIAIGSASGQF